MGKSQCNCQNEQKCQMYWCKRITGEPYDSFYSSIRHVIFCFVPKKKPNCQMIHLSQACEPMTECRLIHSPLLIWKKFNDFSTFLKEICIFSMLIRENNSTASINIPSIPELCYFFEFPRFQWKRFVELFPPRLKWRIPIHLQSSYQNSNVYVSEYAQQRRDDIQRQIAIAAPPTVLN